MILQRRRKACIKERRFNFFYLYTQYEERITNAIQKAAYHIQNRPSPLYCSVATTVKQWFSNMELILFLALKQPF